MKNKIGGLLLLIIFILQLSSCKNYDEPGLINDPSKTYSPSPKISSVSPANSAMAGVREIIINGENFAANGVDTNWVFIGGRPAPVKSVTTNKIVVHRPNVNGTGLTVEVVIPTALGLAKVTGYEIEKPVAQFGDFQYENYPLTAIEFDGQENMYVGTRRKVLKMTPDGINLTTLASLGSVYAKITDMKLGGDGYLYLLVDKITLHRINITTGAQETFADLPDVVDYLDFDTNKNIYACRSGGIFVLSLATKNVITTNKYVGIDLNAIRVYNGYVYVASLDHIWRNKILDNLGNLGSNETVLDLTTVPTYSKNEISHFNIGEDGTIYLCLRGNLKYSLFVLENDKTITPFYTVDILPHQVDQVIWGSGRHLYLNRGINLPRDSVRIFKMGMDKKGAPYFGRK